MFARKKVNLVAIKDDWILHKIAQRLDDGLAYIQWTEQPTRKHKLTYYVNYAQAQPERVSTIELALFTHLEKADKALIKKWQEVARSVNVAVSMSQLYVKDLRKRAAQVTVIPPGVDLDQFTVSPLKIGVVGSTKASGRKGEDLIQSVMDIPGIDWRFTGKGWPGPTTYLKDEELPRFYHDLDYVLIASHYEGGPMSAIEALASGVPIIATPVGWVPELPHIPIKVGSESSLRRVLTKLVRERTKLREAVADRSWDSFIEKHDVLFKKLLGAPSRLHFFSNK